MALIARYLVDTSAAARMRQAVVDAVVTTYRGRGPGDVCHPGRRSAVQRAQSRRVRADPFQPAGSLRASADRGRALASTFDAQRSLARTGRHRSVGIADLRTAALAGDHHLTLVHYDADFDIAGEVMIFDRQWVAPRGSLP